MKELNLTISDRYRDCVRVGTRSCKHTHGGEARADHVPVRLPEQEGEAVHGRRLALPPEQGGVEPLRALHAGRHELNSSERGMLRAFLPHLRPPCLATTPCGIGMTSRAPRRARPADRDRLLLLIPLAAYQRKKRYGSSQASGTST